MISFLGDADNCGTRENGKMNREMVNIIPMLFLFAKIVRDLKQKLSKHVTPAVRSNMV